MVNTGSIIHDATLLLRNIIASGTGIPCYTSYPERVVTGDFPFAIIQNSGFRMEPNGIASMSSQKVYVEFQGDICALNTKDRDVYFDKANYQLMLMQESSSGTVAAGLHDFRLLDARPLDEPGAEGIHRKVFRIQYKFYT